MSGPLPKYNNQAPPTPAPRWEELDELYRNCQQLAARASQPLELLRNRDLVSACKDKQGLLEEAKVLRDDFQQYVQDLDALAKAHNGRTGEIDDPDELMTCLDIGEKYHNWMSSFTSVVLPMTHSVLNRLGVNQNQTTGETGNE